MCASKTNGGIYKSKGPVSTVRSFCRIPMTNGRFGKKHYKPSEQKAVLRMLQQVKEYKEE